MDFLRDRRIGRIRPVRPLFVITSAPKKQTGFVT